MTRQELIDALCKATGPSAKLDFHIAQLCGLNYPPFYTSSLDAARTLVPEGVSWEMRVHSGRHAFVDVDYKGSMYASTEPLALCAAALRARADQ